MTTDGIDEFVRILEQDGEGAARERYVHEPAWDPCVPDLRHCIEFFAAEGSPFNDSSWALGGGPVMMLQATGTFPVPAEGDIVVLHEQPVRVVRVRNTYTRRHGWPCVDTAVHVLPVEEQ